MNAARDFLPRWDFISVDDEAISVEVRDGMSEFANDPTTARRSWTPAAAWPTGRGTGARVEQVLRCCGGSGDTRRSRVSREGVVTYEATAGSPRADFLVQRHHDALLRRILCFLVCRLKSGRNRF